MKKHCEYCGDEFEAKRKTAKYCSDACKLKANRAPQKTTTYEESATDQITEPIDKPIDKPFKHTQTDQLFDDYRPGFYKFEGEPRNRECFSCDKKYSTRLDRLRFCSPTCQQKFLNKFA